MFTNSIKYCLRQVFVAIARNRWLALVSASMIAISLTILGGFLLAAVNTEQVMQNIQANVEIGVFLYDDADIGDLQKRLDELEGIKDYRFVCKHDGLVEFGKSLGDEALLQELKGENNPLPDMFRVRVSEAAAAPLLAEKMEKFPGVETVEFGRELVNILTRISGWLNRLSMAVSILLAMGAVFLIGTTIRLSVLTRQDEIGIMKYLGASNWFIRLPFLLEGLAIGWSGTLVSVVVLGLAYYQLALLLLRHSPLFFLQPVTAPEMLVPIFAGLLILGTLMGGLAGIFSIRRFLKV